MNELDRAFALLGVTSDVTAEHLRRAWHARARQAHPDAGGDAALMQQVNAAYDLCRRHVEQGVTAAEDRWEQVTRDAPSFVIEVLPVVAFEALIVATSWLGEMLVDEPPYLLEVHLHDPAPCWCRLELVPDAGATTVSLTVSAVEQGPTPSAIAVRDRFVTVLNELPLPE